MRNRRKEVDEPVVAGPSTVLVVHDDPDGCELLVRILAAAGMPVHWAHDQDQMATALHEQPACVVLDASSGGIGGNLKLLDAIRHNIDPQIANVRVVLVATGTSSAMFSWQAGIDGFLARPFHADDLVTTVAEVLDLPEDERKPHRRRMAESARVHERG
jgi:DNA-binding NtrC family response regulator